MRGLGLRMGGRRLDGKREDKLVWYFKKRFLMGFFLGIDDMYMHSILWRWLGYSAHVYIWPDCTIRKFMCYDILPS